MNDGPEDTELLVMDAWGAMMILYSYFKDHPEELPPFHSEIDQMRMTAQLLQDRAKEGQHERAQVAAPANRPAPTDYQSEMDREVQEGAKCWANKQANIIAMAERLPDLLMWLDEHGGDWAPDYGPEPDDLEMLQMDAERAAERYADALKKLEAKEGRRHEPV